MRDLMEKAVEAAKLGWGPTIRLVLILAAVAAAVLAMGTTGLQVLAG